MAKMTLLELTQDILNDLESDSVNSINDTVEAQQVAQIVKTTFNNIISGRDWPHLYELFQLEALSDVTKPNYMKIPDTIISLKWVKYNTRTSTDTKDKFTEIRYKLPEEFLVITDARDSSASNVSVVSDSSGVKINTLTDKAPQYFTSFDDQYIVFDSYDSAVDTTMTAIKSSAYGKRDPTFTLSDSFTPDLPVQMFPYLLNESKSTCFVVLKQTTNGKAEQHSTTQRRRMSQEAWKLKNGITYPNYGRK